MHVEQNISNNMPKYLFGEKDTLGIKRDMEEVGMCSSLQLQKKGSNFVKPTTPYFLMLMKNENFWSLCPLLKFLLCMLQHSKNHIAR
jgi:hypothetical protein